MDDKQRGARVREIRDSRTMTQAHLAGAAGISVRTLMRLEAGSGASPETLRAIASVLGVETEALASSGPSPESDVVTPPSLTPVAEPPPARPRRRLPDGAMTALLLCAATLAFCAGHRLSWASVTAAEARNLPDFHVEIDRVAARNMAIPLRSAGASLVDGRPSSGAWATEASQGNVARWPVCPLPTFADFLMYGPKVGDALTPTGECTRHEPGISVGKSGQDGIEASVGPLAPDALSDLVAMLPRHAGLTVRAAFVPDPQTRGDGVLWFDPHALRSGQVPRPNANRYLALRMTPSTETAR